MRASHAPSLLPWRRSLSESSALVVLFDTHSENNRSEETRIQGLETVIWEFDYDSCEVLVWGWHVLTLVNAPSSQKSL